MPGTWRPGSSADALAEPRWPDAATGQGTAVVRLRLSAGRAGRLPRPHRAEPGAGWLRARGGGGWLGSHDGLLVPGRGSLRSPPHGSDDVRAHAARWASV